MEELLNAVSRPQEVRPWLNSNGVHRSDEEIREISKKWDRATWDAYLESIEVGLKETLLKTPEKIDHFVEDYTSLLLNLEKEEKDGHLRRGIRHALRKLSKREHQILELHLVELKNTRQIAEELGISRMNVRRTIERGLAKVQKLVREKNIQMGAALSKIVAAHLQPAGQPDSQKDEGTTQEFENNP